MENPDVKRIEVSKGSPWHQIVTAGMAAAVSRLSMMLGREMEVTYLGIGPALPAAVLQGLGGADARAVGIYSQVAGDARSHMTVVIEAGVASQFVSLLVGREVDVAQAIGGVERSALEEVGNTLGSSFFSTLADAAELHLRTLPPTVALAALSEIVDTVFDDPLRHESGALATEARFRGADGGLSGTLFVIPGQELVEAVVDRIQMSDAFPKERPLE